MGEGLDIFLSIKYGATRVSLLNFFKVIEYLQLFLVLINGQLKKADLHRSLDNIFMLPYCLLDVFCCPTSIFIISVMQKSH
jgi:hypothetical protein